MSADDKEQEEATREKKPKMSKKKKGAIVAGIFLVLIVIIAGVVYYMGHRYYTKTNYMTDDEVQALIEKQKEEQQEKETEEETTVEEEVDPELLEAQQNMAQYASAEPITTDGNVYNIMLVGLDTTDKGWIGNSDSMILISVNYRLEQISMISLMRDTHVMIPGIGYRKLNATYPNGGGPLLVKTVEENYKIDVDRYVTVDFGSMIDIIDEIGTIEITFTPKEAENANKSIKQQCRILGLKSKKYLIPGEGTQTFYDSAALLYPDVFPCIQKNPSHTVLYGRVVHSIPYRLQISFFRFFLPAIPSAASAAGRSIPVVAPKLNIFWYFRNSSGPRRAPICINPSLQECLIRSDRVSVPCAPG